MADLQQLVYISRAAFAASREGLGVEPEVGRILVQSRLNNPRRGLVGALYYGDDCFFQCLEGSPGAIDSLYDALLSDPRHRDLKIVYRRSIGATTFSDWAMKYVPGASEVRTLLKKHGLSRFDPYRFSQDAIRDMVTLLHRGVEDAPAEATRTPPGPGSNRKRMVAAVGVAVAALSVIALLWMQ